MPGRRLTAAAALVAAAAAGSPSPAAAQERPPADARLLEAFTYRNLGPFRMGARTTDVAVPTRPGRDHQYTFYVAFWTGGLWKTTNNGTTFAPVFDDRGTFAIGAVALAPSNPDVVWVGTGDAFTSRSSYAGDGVHRSTDGARTWTHVGLRDAHHIARIVVHPTDPDVAYVAAMGHLHTDNPERGVFRTTDGGRRWERVLFVSDRVGAIDLVMDPRDPRVLYAATYEKQRLPWQMVNGGPGSGIHKTTDGGRTWTRLAAGLPQGRIGRIGLDIHRANPDVLYAVIENRNPRPGAPPTPSGAPATIGGEVYRTTDAGRSWTRTSAEGYDVSPKGAYYFSQIRVHPTDPERVFVTQDALRHSVDGGRTWDGPRMFPRMFGDVRTLWIDPERPERMIQGSDGGIAISYDGGRTGDAYANIPVGEIYGIAADMEDPYNLYAGLQDHEHWKGPSQGPLGRVTIHDWVAVGDNDGIVTQVDPTDSRWLYTTRQYGGHTRVDQTLGYETVIEPPRAAGQPPHRWLWEPPLVVSPHDPRVLYAASQVVLRSDDRGDGWTEISPDLSTNPTDRILRESEGSVPGGIPWFAVSSLAESPLARGLLWAGTSDGRVHVTRDGGRTWTDRTAAIAAAGGREDAYVSRVHPSAHAPGRAYVSKSGYKWDDFRPYLYRTDDHGATWTAIAAGLPDAPINVVLEDSRNPDLLFVGNDAGVYVSLDRGARWTRMNNNMPAVPVRDLLVHPRERDLILGTYARGFWITNVRALEELTDAVRARDAHLFTIGPTTQRVTWQFGANDYLFGQRHLQTPNDPPGMTIRYHLRTPGRDSATLVIADSAGVEVARLRGPAAAGINTVVWSTRRTGATSGGAAAYGRGGRRGGETIVDQLVPLGRYTVRLEVGGTSHTQSAAIVRTQGWRLGAGAAETIRAR